MIPILEVQCKTISNHIPIAFDQATSSKTTTLTAKSPSSLIEKESYQDKKYD